MSYYELVDGLVESRIRSESDCFWPKTNFLQKVVLFQAQANETSWFLFYSFFVHAEDKKMFPTFPVIQDVAY